MPTVTNILHDGRITAFGRGSRTNGRSFSEHVMKPSDRRHPPNETNKQFIKRMKLESDSWGWQQGHLSRNAYSMGRGWVEIFDATGKLAQTMHFQTYIDKLKLVRFAWTQIKNLKGCCIETNHL